MTLSARMAHAQGRSDAFPWILGGPLRLSARTSREVRARCRGGGVSTRGGVSPGAIPRAGAALCGESLAAQVRGECVDRRGVQPRAVACFAERRRGRAAAGGHGDFAAAGKLFCESSAGVGGKGRAHAATVTSPCDVPPTSARLCPSGGLCNWSLGGDAKNPRRFFGMCVAACNRRRRSRSIPSLTRARAQGTSRNTA